MDTLKKYGTDVRIIKEASLFPELDIGRVTLQYNNLYKVATDSGEALAEVSGKLRFDAKKPSDFPAVGDFVMVSRKGGAGNAVIHHVLSRKSIFERTAAGTKVQSQVVAANIDYVFICMSLVSDFNLRRLERYLSVAWSSGATPVVVLTKADLCGDITRRLEETASVAVGAEVVTVSSLDERSYQALFSYLREGVTASFIGSSGVGKSTLINRLADEELLATSDIRSDGKGRHTTTRRELILLKNGGIVIDTPGMRELGVDSADLSQSFADIDTLAGLCKFGDCTHSGEPGCAIAAAIADGMLDAKRFENYEKLKKEARYDGLNAKQIEAEKINAMFGGMGSMKQMRRYAKEKNSRKG